MMLHVFERLPANLGIMMTMSLRSHFLIVLFVSILAFPASAAQVKKSKSGICHDHTSPHFDKTTRYESFSTLKACLASGGRLPRGAKQLSTSQQQQMDSALTEAASQGRAFALTYDRHDYKHWIDVDGDCQNTRQEILIIHSMEPVVFTNPKRCTVKRGSWHDPYSNKQFTLASDLDVDHIVPLHFAHIHGAASWPSKQKEAFANDPFNLILVDDQLNQSKSAQGPTEWLPPNQAYRCDYIRRFDQVMQKYQLKYFSSEERVLKRMREACESN